MRLLIALVPLGLVGCGGLNCTEMYAPSGVSIGFEASDWPAGDYVFEIDGIECDVTLPGSDGAFCESGGAALELLTDASGAAVQSAWLQESTPDPLSIVVSRDGTVIFEDEVSPAYTVDEPNGKGCGERTSASVTVSIDG